MSDKPKTVKVTLRLLKKKVRIEEAISEDHNLIEYTWPDIPESRFYAGTVYSNPPAWLSYVQSAVPDVKDLFNSGSAAILFVPIDDRILILSFGHSHFVIDVDRCERNFGLKVTLNKVARESLRSLDSATPDSVTIQRRVQASRDSDISVFGVDYNRDLLTLAAGTPGDKDFAKFLAGKDSLSMTCALSPGNILEKCRDAFDAYSTDEYKKNYPWVDYIQPVKDKEQIRKLDDRLLDAVKELRSGNLNELHLAPPEVVDYMEGSELHYNGFGSGGVVFQSLDVRDYVDELNRCGFEGDMAEIKKNHRIAVQREGENAFAERWRVYNSFVFETEVDTHTYVLFSGSWFVVDQDFAQEVDDFFSDTSKVKLIGPTDQPNEEKLNAHLHSTRSSDLLMLDRSKINPKGANRASIEPCDFLSLSGQFIHIKDGGSSGPISHLWMQGVVSAESFLMDETFRKNLRKEVKKRDKKFENLIPDGRSKVNPLDYPIVYAIMRKPYVNGAIGLPFFSKVSFRTAAIRLQSMGFPVAVELIPKVVPKKAAA